MKVPDQKTLLKRLQSSTHLSLSPIGQARINGVQPEQDNHLLLWLFKPFVMLNFYKNFIAYKHPQRRDHVIYLVLLVFLLVSIACFLISFFNWLIQGSTYKGVPVPISFFLLSLVIAGTTLFRYGYTKLVSYLLLLFLLFACLNIVYNTGPENVFAILLMVFYVTVCAITFKGKSFFSSIFALLISFFLLAYVQVKGIVDVDSSWKSIPTRFGDVVGIIVILSIIIFISWLFNHEINDYISQLEDSKKLLKKERDLLEIRVEERTKQLQAEQVEKMTEFSKFAEFGRLAQGLFHDLMNPLTALSLNLNQIRKDKNDRVTELNEYIEGATAAANNIEKLIQSTRNYFRHKMEKTSFSISDELDGLYQIIRFKAEKAGIKLVFQNKEDVKIYGNKTRFSQLIGNLVLNAIEAYEHKKQKSTEKEVVVSFYQKKDFVILTVKDSASGMSDQTINKIFKPFFSTKENSGNTGIGLTMCKDIVESEFMGKIDVKSELGKGTEFKISLPQPEVS